MGVWWWWGLPSRSQSIATSLDPGIISHLACYARVGPEHIPDGDSHREWKKKKPNKPNRKTDLEMAPPAKRAGSVTTHLFLSLPGLSGLIWWQIRLSYLNMVWNNPTTPSVPRGDRREKVKTAVASLPKYTHTLRQVRERGIRKTSSTEQCYSPAWCFPPPLHTSGKEMHLFSE